MHDTFASPVPAIGLAAPKDNVTLTALSDKARDELWRLKPSKGEPQAVAAAILFREILESLADSLGPVGEIALGEVADELFVRSRQ